VVKDVSSAALNESSSGFYILTVLILSCTGLPKLFEADTHVSGSGIFGSVAKGRKLFFQLKGAYHGSSTNRFEDDDSPAKTDIISLGYSDASAVYCQFPQWSRFLGAEVLFDATNSKQTEQASSSPLVLAKDFFLQVKWLT